MNKLNKKEKTFMIIRAIIVLLVIIFMIFATIKALPLISKLSNEQSRIEFKEEIANKGIGGILTVLGLQILQIVVAIIPGQPMEIVSGMLYGTWGGIALCLVGIFIGTALVYFIVRRAGMDFIQLFFKKEKIDEIRNSKLFRNPQKFELLLFVMFVLPLVPKDIFIYVGGLSPIKPKRFLALATFARIPGLFITVYAGNKLSEGSFLTVILLILLFLALGFCGYIISQRTKEKLENEDIKEEVEE